jgi:nucleoside-diphosphate-sugar epimerase
VLPWFCRLFSWSAGGQRAPAGGVTLMPRPNAGRRHWVADLPQRAPLTYKQWVRVFVAGGTGAIGRPLVRSLAAKGHEVTVLTRSADTVASLQSLGAQGVVADALDASALRRVVLDARPEVVVNQLTKLPTSASPRALRQGLAKTGELRSVVSRSLAQAAAAAGARRVVAQSISFAYRPGPGMRVEDDPLYLDGPAQIRHLVEPVAALERSAHGLDIESVVLRYGAFYGPGTYYGPDGLFVNMIAKRRLPIPTTAAGLFGFIHLDDAVSATLAALEGPAGTYNVVDDVPAPTHEWVPFVAQLIGAKTPHRLPLRAFSVAAGAYSAYLFAEQPAVANDRAKAQLGWSPRFPDWHAGLREVMG